MLILNIHVNNLQTQNLMPQLTACKLKTFLVEKNRKYQMNEECFRDRKPSSPSTVWRTKVQNKANRPQESSTLVGK